MKLIPFSLIPTSSDTHIYIYIYTLYDLATLFSISPLQIHKPTQKKMSLRCRLSPAISSVSSRYSNAPRSHTLRGKRSCTCASKEEEKKRKKGKGRRIPKNPSHVKSVSGATKPIDVGSHYVSGCAPFCIDADRTELIFCFSFALNG